MKYLDYQTRKIKHRPLKDGCKFDRTHGKGPSAIVKFKHLHSADSAYDIFIPFKVSTVFNFLLL